MHVLDGGYTIQSAVPENPMLHAYVTALCLIERELLPIAVLHCGNRNFRRFGSCDLDLDPMTIYELDQSIIRRDTSHVQIWTSYVKAFESCLTDYTYNTYTTKFIYHAAWYINLVVYVLYMYPHRFAVDKCARTLWTLFVSKLRHRPTRLTKSHVDTASLFDEPA